MFFGPGSATQHRRTNAPSTSFLIVGSSPRLLGRPPKQLFFAITIGMLIAISACNQAPSQGGDPPLSSEHTGREETLVGANDERVILARADYPALDNPASGALALPKPPEQLTVVSIKSLDGTVSSLNTLFPRPMADVPVSDGTWLAALDAEGNVWLADLAHGVVEPVNFAAPIISLYCLRHPWLIAGDASGVFFYNLSAGKRIDLPALVDPDTVALNPPRAAYILAQGEGLEEIHLADLSSDQDVIADSVADAQLFLYAGNLQYVTLDTEQQAYFVKTYDASKGSSSIAARVKSVPNPGETQSIIDVGSRGYLLRHHFRNDSNILIEQLEILRETGDRDMLTVYGAIDQTGVVAHHQPRFAGDHLVYRDPVDGFWIIADLATSGTRRVNPFR